jgi:hypothetical protein
MLAVRCRALANARRWNGAAAHSTTGSASAVSSSCHPSKRALGMNANITERSASGKKASSATNKRRRRSVTSASSAPVPAKAGRSGGVGSAEYPAATTASHSRAGVITGSASTVAVPVA